MQLKLQMQPQDCKNTKIFPVKAPFLEPQVSTIRSFFCEFPLFLAL